MKTTRHALCLVCCAGPLLFARAGEIDPSLREKIAGAAPMEMLRVVARLTAKADVHALDASLRGRGASRKERHAAVIGALQGMASATQASLRSYLAEQEQRGNVRAVVPYWIENMIEFSAPREIIETVAGRGDVETVFPEPEIFYDPPLEIGGAPERVNSSEAGLRAIRAPLLWRLGIAGQGRIVMNIDTGVRGDHPALASRWRARLPGVDSTDAWYHNNGSTFPQDADNPGHGTHTMGTMTGYNPATGDTVGVAPAAYWIAGAGSYTGAFQWAADPDGNPFTFDDVPDVINCSWFVSGDLCGAGAQYWTLMDNVELAGAVVIWSAGNCGPGGSSGSCTGGAVPGPYMTITPPKNRVSSEVNAFSVGALDGNSGSLLIASFSSRGPSACDTTIVKPEVAAPGISVRSTIANGSFGIMSGTSMAAPHVSGAVALLRQINPEADADRIKLALLNTARDLGAVGEDNSYGTGIIDVFAAAEAVSPYQVAGVITSAQTSAPLPDALVSIPATLQERGADSAGIYTINPLLDSVVIRITAFRHRDTSITILPVPDVPLVLNVALRPLPTVTVAGTVRDSISGNGVGAELRWFAEGDPSAGPTYVTQAQANGSYALPAVVGTYRIDVDGGPPHPDLVRISGVSVPDSGRTLDIMLAQARVVLVDDDAGGAYDTVYQKALDRLGHRYRSVAMADSGMSLPDVLSTFARPPALLWFTGDDSTDVLAAAERQVLISHLDNGGGAILTGQNIAQQAAPDDTLLAGYLGVRYNGGNTSSYVRGIAGDPIGNGINYLFVGGAGNQTSKDVLTFVPGSRGVPVRTLFYGTPTDTQNTAGVRVLGPGASWATTFYGFGFEGLAPSRIDTLIARSLRYFSQIVTGVSDPAPGIPEGFALSQNYPNPFNPVTVITYALPAGGPGGATSYATSLQVFDLLGRRVATLVEETKAPGVYTATFDASHLASGVYLYRLSAGAFVATRKLMLVK